MEEEQGFLGSQSIEGVADSPFGQRVHSWGLNSQDPGRTL